jgi:HK97 gp10 family phage protein
MVGSVSQQFRIQGADRAINILKTLGTKLQRKYLGKAVRKGATIVRLDASARARTFDRADTPNKIWKEIVVRSNSRLARKNGGIALSVGVKGGARQYVNNKTNRQQGRVGGQYEGPGKVYYWRFLEFGTKKMAKQPFMVPALQGNVDKVTTVIVNELNLGIDAIVAGGA